LKKGRLSSTRARKRSESSEWNLTATITNLRSNEF
jgi:hypothetical protein